MHSPSDESAQLSRISALLGAGKLSEAESACRTLLAKLPNHAAATHLLGLIRVRGGSLQDGEELIHRSIELEPRNPTLRVNLANHLRRRGRLAEAEVEYRRVLQEAPGERSARHSLALTLSDVGRLAEAEAECRRLLAQAPEDPEAWCALGLILDRQERLPQAEQAYGRALQINPDYGLAHHNLGSVLARLDRAEESLAALDRTRQLGIRGFELSFNRGLALLSLYRLEEAEAAFADAVLLQPRHADAQLNLARLRHMRSDPDFAGALAAAATAHPEDAKVQGLLALVLVRAGAYEHAEQRLHDTLRRLGPLPQLRFVLSQVLRESGRVDEAESHAIAAAEALPADAGIIENLVSILLSRGRPGDAMPFIRAQRARDPTGQNWLAYEATAARLLGEPQYEALFDYERLVRTFTLEPPPGWASLVELNSALLATLAQRHRFSLHPLDQSLRHGSQTTRDLVADPDPAIQAVLQAFQDPLRQYLSEVGHDSSHPFRARNAGAATIKSGWSVQLRRGGFHVNHYHNRGWISSAYYVSVPQEAEDGELKSGWLKFGEPRFDTPEARPACFIRPVAGKLVLFPSYMWHGTNAIQGSQARLTIAFDAVPARPPGK